MAAHQILSEAHSLHDGAGESREGARAFMEKHKPGFPGPHSA